MIRIIYESNISLFWLGSISSRAKIGSNLKTISAFRSRCGMVNNTLSLLHLHSSQKSPSSPSLQPKIREVVTMSPPPFRCGSTSSPPPVRPDSIADVTGTHRRRRPAFPSSLAASHSSSLAGIVGASCRLLHIRRSEFNSEHRETGVSNSFESNRTSLNRIESNTSL